MMDVTTTSDQDIRRLSTAAKPSHKVEQAFNAHSDPTSPGACSSLSSAGPSWFAGSPRGTPKKEDQGDVSSRSGQADSQLQPFKWSENPMLGVASPAASLSTPNSATGMFHTPASVAQQQLGAGGDKFFTPYNNSAFNDAHLGGNDQFYTPTDGGVLRSLSKASRPSLLPPSARRAACSPCAAAAVPAAVDERPVAAAADKPCEWKVTEAAPAVSLRSISNIGSPPAGQDAEEEEEEEEEEVQSGRWGDGPAPEEGAQVEAVQEEAACAEAALEEGTRAETALGKGMQVEAGQKDGAAGVGGCPEAGAAEEPYPVAAARMGGDTPFLIKRVRGGSASPLSGVPCAASHRGVDSEELARPGQGNAPCLGSAAAAGVAVPGVAAQGVGEQQVVVMGNGAAGQAGAMGADTSTGQLNVASLQVWQGGCPGQGAAAAQRKEEAPSAPLARNAGAEALTAGSGGCGTTPPPAFHDPRSLAALHSSSRGRHGQWACGHAAGPAPPPPPKPHTTPIPEHLLRATSLVLRTNRPEPDPVSARRLKMTLPKTPMLATAQRLGSHPSMRRQETPASSAAPSVPAGRPRRASYTHTPTHATPAAAQAAKPRRASYTHTPPTPPAGAAGSAEEAAEIAARFAALSSRVTSMASRTAAGMGQEATKPGDLTGKLHAAAPEAPAPAPAEAPEPTAGGGPATGRAARKADSTAARDGARAAAAAAAAAAARAKAVQVSPLRAAGASAMGARAHVAGPGAGTGRAAPAAAADREKAPAGQPGKSAAPAGSGAATPLRSQPGSAAATPSRKATPAATAAAAGARAGIKTPPRAHRPAQASAAAVKSTPEQVRVRSAAPSTPPLPTQQQPQRSASAAPQRKAWPGLPPTRAQQRSASAMPEQRRATAAAAPAPPTKSPNPRILARTPERKAGAVAAGSATAGATVPGAAAAVQAQHAQATAQRRVQAAAAAVAAARPATAPAPAVSRPAAAAAVARPGTAAGGRATRPAAARPTTTPTKVQAASGAAKAPALPLKQQQQQPHHHQPAAAQAARKQAKPVVKPGEPGKDKSAAALEAASPVPAAPAKKPAVPRLGKRVQPAARAPAPAPPAPAAQLEPLPSFFKKPSVPRLSAKAAAQGARPAEAAPAAAAAVAEKASKQAGGEGAGPTGVRVSSVQHGRRAQGEPAAPQAPPSSLQAGPCGEDYRQQDQAGALQDRASTCVEDRTCQQPDQAETRQVAGGAGDQVEGAAHAADAPAPPAFVRPQVPKLNMQAVAAVAARDKEEEEQAAHALGVAPAPAAPLPLGTSVDTAVAVAAAVVATAHQAPSGLGAAGVAGCGAAAAAAAAQEHGSLPAGAGVAAAGKAAGAAKAPAKVLLSTTSGTPVRPATAPSAAITKAKPAPTCAAPAAAAGAARAGRARRNSAAAVPQVRPPGMWSPPPPRAGARDAGAPPPQLQQEHQGGGARGGRVRRASCTDALLAKGPANPGRAAAMAASLRAIKEEGAAATSAVKGVQAPSPVGVSAPPATQAPEAEAGAQARDLGSPDTHQPGLPLGASGACHLPQPRCSPAATGPALGLDVHTPCPAAQESGAIGPKDLSLAWATTPYTSLTLEKLPPVAAGPPSGASSACGSGCASLASPGSHASLSVPQMPSLGAGILPSPFVPAGVQPARKDDFAARGSVGSAASFSLCRPGGGAAAGEQQRQQQQQLTEGLQGTCSRDGDGCNRESLGAAVMTPVLMHPFVVATPVPPIAQETPRLGQQIEYGRMDDAATPAGLPMLTPAPQLPNAQELQDLVGKQQLVQQTARADAEQQQQQQGGGAEDEAQAAGAAHFMASLAPAEEYEWGDESYEACGSLGPAAFGDAHHAAATPPPLTQYEEWGSPDDSPVRDQQAQGENRRPAVLNSAAKLQAACIDLKGSLDVTAAAHANFSFTSEIGALRMSTFEPATIPRTQ